MKRLHGFYCIVGFALMIGTAVALVGAAADIGMRSQLKPDYDQNEKITMSRADVRTIWRYKPGLNISYSSPEFAMQVRTNEEGLRGGSLAGMGDSPTILFIGNSFTFGWGVAEEQRFSDVIGRLLEQADPGRPVRIVNAGHWLYSFDQQLVLMKELIARYRPKVVVQDFYWMFVRLLYGHEYVRSDDRLLQSVKDAKIDIDRRGVLRFRSDKMEGAGDWVSYLRPGEQNAQLWQLTDNLVDETIRTVRASGAEYVPFLAPGSVEFPGGNWATVGWTGKSPPADVDVDRPVSRLASMFSRRGVDIIGLAPTMRAELASGKSFQLFYPQDGHWTPETHALVARILIPHVAKALTPQR